MFKTLFRQAQAHEDSIWSVKWSKNEKHDYIVTGSVDNTVKSWYWDGNTLESRHKLEGHSLGVVSVDVDDSGTHAASSSIDNNICIWDLDEGRKVNTINAGAVNSWTLAFHPNGENVASGSNTGDVNIFNIKTGAKQSFDAKGQFTMSVAFSPDGLYLAAGSKDGRVTVYNVETGAVVHKTEAHAMPIRSVCFSGDSGTLYTASDDGLVRIFDAKHGDSIATLSGHVSWVLSVAHSPDGAHFCTGSSDKTVKVWNLAQRQCVHTFEDHTDQVWSVSYDRLGRRIASVGEDAYLNIYECP